MNIKSNSTLFKSTILLVLLILFCPTGHAQTTLISEMDQLKWEKVMPGIWKASVGSMGLNPMDYANSPKTDAINELGDAPFPFAQEASRSLLTSNRASVRLPLDESEQIYGLGLEFEGINRRSEVYSLKVDHYGDIKGQTHAPVPFYISNKGYGVLINSAQRVKIHVGVSNRKDSNLPERIDRTTGKNWAARPLSDAVEASVEGGGMEIFVFSGETTLEIVQRYNLFFGGGIIPPKWGLGFWHRMHTQSRDKDILKEIEDFEANNFPLDVIGLEPGWQSFAYPCSFDWDKTRFPDPKNFVQTLDKKGIKVNLWENPYVAPVSTMYNDISPYTGSHTVWLGEVPDYTIPEAQKVLLNHHQKHHLDIGVSGYKFDEVDGYDVWLWPDHATFPSGNDAVEIRQLYGMMMMDMFDRHFKEQNQRTYNLIRSAYIGASNHNFVLYSDYYDHKGYVTALANSSLSGLLWTPEIRSADSAEEWIRRFQSVSFSPLMMLNAWYSSKKPWSFPEVTDMVRNTIELRMKLLPYLYTAFYEYNQKGIPPFRAMVLETGYDSQEKLEGSELDDAKNPYAEQKRLEVTDQYMMGPSILVAPVFTGQKERKVVLPIGNWFNFYNGEYAGNGETITIKTKLEEIPLFVKDGGIIPMLTTVDKNDSDQTLEVRHYGTKENTYLLYNDDGISYDYERDKYSLTELKSSKNTKGELTGSFNSLKENNYSYSNIVWRWMTMQH
ncbi:glycoside hydrolase family 31 protein [Algoriphagus boritolerans]|nr:TIM-barrel domain-containing protein [Algoriphagus boritolerans]